MKEVRLNNVIFPIWFLLFFPPVIFITLAGNFIIDSLVLVVCFYCFKLSNINNLKTFYKETIIKVWLFGFLADIIGAAILFTVGILGDSFDLPYNIISAVNYNPFDNVFAFIIITVSMLISALFIFIFNYRYALAKQIADKSLRFKVSLTLAIVTMPWTFLLPTKLFYKGF